jgi:hypothetical protein
VTAVIPIRLRFGAWGLLALTCIRPLQATEPESQFRPKQATITVDYWEKPFDIPSPKNISQMTAECYNNVFPNTGQIEIPRKHFDRIIKEIEAFEIDPNPLLQAWENGTLQIRYSEKESLRVCWYSYGSRNGGRLSFNGVPVRIKGSDEYGGSNGLDGIIRAIADEVKREKGPRR